MNNHLFKTPLDAMLEIFPLPFWEKNCYAEQKLLKKKEEPIDSWVYMETSYIKNCNDLLWFVTLYPQTGYEMHEGCRGRYHAIPVMVGFLLYIGSKINMEGKSTSKCT